MLDAVVAGEQSVGVVQLSGGEPTLHPDFWAILDAVRARPIRYLMINTNGRRLGEDAQFAHRLASYKPNLEVYLQFDSLRPATLRQLRGADVSALRLRALEALNREKISTTLVMTLLQGVNDQEIGAVLDFAVSQKCVRGMTLQPIQGAGRLHGFDPDRHRLTLTQVRREILSQQKVFGPRDLVPVPCHGDSLAIAYALRRAGGLVPLSKLTDPQGLIDSGGNTICYEQDPKLRAYVQSLLAAGAPGDGSSPAASIAQALGLGICLPLLPKHGSPIAYEDVFRVVIMQFMDAWSMDLRSLKRSCVHIVAPDGRLVPFETYNLLYRDRRFRISDCAQPALTGAQPSSR
jgi:uncharacterized radical SAM superfamily Fe-S cluster-containing enzyme